MMNLQYFAFLCIFDGFLNCWGVFVFAESLSKPVAKRELSNWSVSKAWQVLTKKIKILRKRPAVATCLLMHAAPTFGNWFTGVYLRIIYLGPSNHTTFQGLCSPGDYRQSIESPVGVPTFNSTEKALIFTIYDCILRTRPQICVILRKLTFIKKSE